MPHRKNVLILCLLIALVSSLQAGSNGITPQMIGKWQEKIPAGLDKAMADAVANQKISDLALNRDRLIEHNDIVNMTIKTGSITNQNSSGRCWILVSY